MDTPEHFKDKDALGHVAEAQIQGMVSAAEIHGTELPGHLNAATDAARDTALVMTLFLLIFNHFQLPFASIFYMTAILGAGWLLWKAGRSAWIGWARLERLHRVIAQEKWEIEHHRQQERDELRALYSAKGFSGKLLEDVIDVLMADGDRLLRVMVEEEMGFTLENHEHPLKQALGAAIGALLAWILCLAGLFLNPQWGLPIAAALILIAFSAFAATRERNKAIPAAIWNLGLAFIAGGFVYFMLDLFFPQGV